MDAKELDFLIKGGEGYNLQSLAGDCLLPCKLGKIEFKESLPSDMGKCICAFANASGGKILLGVADSGAILGVAGGNALRSQIHDVARNMDPKINVSLSQVGKVLVVEVPEGGHKPYSVAGKFYMRQGANSQQLGRDEIREFFQKEGMVLFDEKPNPDFDLQKDVGARAYSAFIKLCGISRLAKRRMVLENLSLLRNGRMKNAGVLIFSKDVTRFLRNATIICTLFEGREGIRIIDSKEFSSDLYSNYDGAISYLRAKLNTEYIIKGGPREERLELPLEALREAVLNAIAHRSYFSNAAIQVRILSNRVEIINPGGLAPGMKMSDLGRKSVPRNPLLFGLMQRMDLVERAGTGILRINGAMKEYGLGKPEIESDEDWFSIIFARTEPVSDGSGNDLEKDLVNDLENLSANQRKIISEIQKNRKITQERLSLAVGISAKNIRNNISKLKANGVLSRIGPDKGGHWEITARASGAKVGKKVKKSR